MKALGIVRKIDELGRIVVPKEVRKANGWKPGTPIEMFATVDGVTMKEYKREEEKRELLDQLQEVLRNTSNSEAYKIVSDTIFFLRKQ